MSDSARRVTVDCANHHEMLIKRLWKFMCTRHRVDLDFSGAGRTIGVHHLIVDAFLQPDTLARSILNEKHLRRNVDGGCSSLGALLEFMYRGKVTVREEKLADLLEVAKELDFKMLVDAIESKVVIGNGDVIDTGGGIELGDAMITDDIVTSGDAISRDTIVESGDFQVQDVVMTSEGDTISDDALTSDVIIESSGVIASGVIIESGVGDIITCTSAVILESGDVIQSDDVVTCYELVESDLVASVDTTAADCPDTEFVTSSTRSECASDTATDIVLPDPINICQSASAPDADSDDGASDWERRLSEADSDDDSGSNQTLNVIGRAAREDAEDMSVEAKVAALFAGDADEPRFKCPRCDYATHKRWRFSHHMFSRHQLNCRGETVEKRVCEDCKFVCKTESQMKYHRLATHSGTRPYSCPQCSFTSGRKVAIGHHVRTVHQRLRPHLCDECGYSTACAYGLIRHKRKHNGEKPFKCGTCRVGFSDHSGLRRHERAGHGSGDKPHVCHVCGNSYNRRDNLRAHLLKNHHITMGVEACAQ